MEEYHRAIGARRVQVPSEEVLGALTVFLLGCQLRLGRGDGGRLRQLCATAGDVRKAFFLVLPRRSWTLIYGGRVRPLLLLEGPDFEIVFWIFLVYFIPIIPRMSMRPDPKRRG